MTKVHSQRAISTFIPLSIRLLKIRIVATSLFIFVLYSTLVYVDVDLKKIFSK